MKKILYLVRTEADFERVVCLAIAGKLKFKQSFVFTGDFSPFFKSGILNEFQKQLFENNGFEILDFYRYDFFLNLLNKLLKFDRPITIKDLKDNIFKAFEYIIYVIFLKILNKRKFIIINKIINKVSPDFLLTDQSGIDPEYIQEIFRKVAFKCNIPVFTFTHGAAGGLHSEFTEPIFLPYKNYTLFVCNDNETSNVVNNRIVLGDVCSSYNYTHFINNLEGFEIDYLNDRKFRVAIFMGGIAQHTATSGWYAQEEFIIENGNNPDVAIIVKLHPRETEFIDLRMILQFENVKIVHKETDRSRIVKWSNIVICSDHCSTIFSPMILSKKVVAIRGKHIPMYKDCFSPLVNSSVNFIDKNNINLSELRNADSLDSITNEICWGNNGPIDLADKLLSYLH